MHLVKQDREKLLLVHCVGDVCACLSKDLCTVMQIPVWRSDSSDSSFQRASPHAQALKSFPEGEGRPASIVTLPSP